MVEIYDFLIENQIRKMGIDAETPRFSWKMRSERKNVVQQSFSLIVRRDDGKVMWKYSAQNAVNYAVYTGIELAAHTEYTVELCITDNYHNTATKSLCFETGKRKQPWNGKWIGADVDPSPIYALEKTAVLNKKVKKARLYATACGLYEFYIGKARVGDMYFAPFWTDYRRRIEYQTYDITSLLLQGENRLTMLIGKGWYAGALGFAGERANYGSQTAGLAELHVTYEDGEESIIVTDESWSAKATEIEDSEFYYGETQNYRKDEVEYPVKIFDFGKEKIIGQINEPVVIIERKEPIATFITPKGEYVVDFGQNLVGFVEISLKETKVQSIRLLHAEVLDKDGNFYTDNLRTAKSEDCYHISENEKILAPKFTFHGFRYVKVVADEPENLRLTACVMHTDMRRSGKFVCSHKQINRLQENIVWGQRGNFVDVPTDCPQRDERLGWTGDANVFYRTAAFHYDVSALFKKWLGDLAAGQGEDGNVPHIVPDIMPKQDGAALWCDAATMIPWNQYLVYGDKAILEEQFDSMKGWADYISSKCGGNGLWQSGFQYGDWLALDSSNLESRTGASDKYFIANIFYYVTVSIVANTAKELGYVDLHEEYYCKKTQLLRCIRSEYFTETGRMVSETQTCCALALYFNIVPKKHRKRLVGILLNNLAETNYHLNTGFAGTPFLLHALSENGEHAAAVKILFKEDYPSWLYAVGKGATTIWERWNGIMENGELFDPAMNSFNHYAYGSVGDFLYRKVAGLDCEAPGYKKIVIKPNLTANMPYVKVEYKCPYGKIVCGYSCKEGKIKVFAEIPCNTTATVYLPETEKKLKVGSGTYEWVYDTTTDLTPKKYTMESTFGKILSSPYGKQILEETSPGILSGPMIAFAEKMTLDQLCAYSGEEGKNLFESVISRLNEMEQQ